MAAVLTALPGRAQSEGPAGCGDLGTVATAVCPLTGGVLPVPTARGPTPPGVFARQYGRTGTEAPRLVPAWGWQCRCVVGDAGQEQDDIRKKGHVGGPQPWGSRHGNGLGLIPHGGSTPPAVPHSTPKQAPRALAAAQEGLPLTGPPALGAGNAAKCRRLPWHPRAGPPAAATRIAEWARSCAGPASSWGWCP